MNNTINGRTPDEIKKGLNHCFEDGCKQCPYKYDCDMADGFSVLAGDAFAYIHQLERERDAAVELLHGFCGACANEGKHEICVECSRRLPFEPDDKDDYWQWRGVQEEVKNNAQKSL